MKREIKFRGFSKITGKWVYGNLFYWIRYGKKIPIIGDGVQNGSVTGLEVDPASIGQFTGLKDKNGKDIYEGDIFKASDFNHYYEVFYGKYGWAIRIYLRFGKDECPLINDLLSHYKISGNIYQNSKLLKQKS